MNKELILHKSTKLQIESVLSGSNIHAVGLLGSKGSGKSFLAKKIASRLLKTTNIDENPYILIIDCQKESGIETSRSIKKFLELRVPSENEFNRCLILESIENLTAEAQNALLKTIEEPPAGTIIVATCSSKNLLRPTVTSRLQWVNVLPIDKQTLKSNFASSLDESKFNQAYAISQGNLASFLSLIEDKDNDTKINAIKKAKELIAMNRFERLCQVEKIVKDDSLATTDILSAMNQVLRAVLLSRSKSGESKDIKNLTKKVSLVHKAQIDLASNISEKLILTNLFYKF